MSDLKKLKDYDKGFRDGYEAKQYEINRHIKDILMKFDCHRKTNLLWKIPEDESWSMAEEWIEEAFK